MQTKTIILDYYGFFIVKKLYICKKKPMNDKELQNFVKEIIKINRNNKELSLARKIDDKTSFFADRQEMTGNNFENKYFNTFVENIKNKLANNLSELKFLNSISLPLEVNAVCEKIQTQIGRSWQAINKNIVPVLKSKNKEKGNKYFIDLDFYKLNFFNIYSKKPNSLIYFTISEKIKTPKFIFSENLLAYKYKEIGKTFDFVIFEENANIIYLSNEIYVKFKTNGNVYGDLTLIDSQKIVNLDVAPVFHVSNEKFNLKYNFVKANYFTSYFTDLELYQELVIYKKMLTPYAFNLIVERILQEDCNYRTEDVFCKTGFLFQINENGKATALHKRCPSCNSALSPGMEVNKTKPLKLSGDSKVDNEAIKFVEVPTGSLAYSDKFLNELTEKIYNSILGIKKEVNNNQNANELATASSERSLIATLISQKNKFEDTIKLIENTTTKWLNNSFDFWEVNLGTKFNLQSVDEILVELESVEKSYPEHKKQIKRKLINANFATEKSTLKRELILLEVFPDIDIENPYVNEIKKIIQSNFNEFINLYEINKNIISDYRINSEIIKDLNVFLEQEAQKMLKNLIINK